MGTAQSLIGISVGGQSLLIVAVLLCKTKYPTAVLLVLETELCSAHVGMKILTSALPQYIWEFVGMCDGVADQLLYW